MKNDEFKSFSKEFNYQIHDMINMKSILEKSNYKETFSGFTSMSTFLLVKTVKSFINTKFSYCDNMNANLDFIDIKDLMTKQSILSDISNHTNENF